MAIIKCKMCGGNLNITEGIPVAECEYCGSVQTVPTADSEKKINLFARANRLRLACEFDKAAGVYESIVAEFPEEAEAYWGLVLCRYGIEYVDDPQSSTKIPTCHRSSFDSIMEDSDFEQTLENADVMARKVYREEAKAIEELRKGILEVSSKEEPYDIFICYKETDEKGDRTIDSVIAQDVYDALREKGYRVFFSRISLEDKLGTEYEPYIFAALNSAKVMLVFGTDYEYYNAVWVKNEWSRFLALIATGQKKTLIPCYKSIDVYDMPKEFAKLQAQDMGKVGAVQDLLRGIGKIIQSLNGKSQATDIKGQVETQLKQQANAQANNLVRLGILSLNSGDFQKSFQQFEEAIKIGGDHVGAYLGLIRITKDKASRPYAKCLETCDAKEIETWLKENPEMLDTSYLPLLDNIIISTESPILAEAVLRGGAKPDNTYAMHYALISKNRIELTKLLLRYGADVNRVYKLKYNDSTENCSPLSTAIWNANDTELAKILIDHGANVNYIISNNNGASWSVLDAAIRMNNTSMVHLLLKCGADANIPSKYLIQRQHLHYWRVFENVAEERLPLLSIADNKPMNVEIAKELLEHTKEIDYIATTGRGEKWTLLDCAVRKNDLTMVQLLLSHGANPNVECMHIYDRYNNAYEVRTGTPLTNAILYSASDDIFCELLVAGANPNVRCVLTMYYTSSGDGPDFKGENYSLAALATKEGKEHLIGLINLQIEKQNLKTQLNTLQEKLSGVSGLFVNMRRKAIEQEINDIKSRIARLGG